jgi:hypothetical protein
MSDDKTQTQAQPDAPPTRKPVLMSGGLEVPTFYANAGAIVVTPFDMQIVFGELQEVTEKAAQARAIARIIMSPEHAALLLASLAGQLQEFIKRSGPLRRGHIGTDAPNLLDALEAASQKAPPSTGE